MNGESRDVFRTYGAWTVSVLKMKSVINFSQRWCARGFRFDSIFMAAKVINSWRCECQIFKDISTRFYRSPPSSNPRLWTSSCSQMQIWRSVDTLALPPNTQKRSWHYHRLTEATVRLSMLYKNVQFALTIQHHLPMVPCASFHASTFSTHRASLDGLPAKICAVCAGKWSFHADRHRKKARRVCVFQWIDHSSSSQFDRSTVESRSLWCIGQQNTLQKYLSRLHRRCHSACLVSCYSGGALKVITQSATHDLSQSAMLAR